MKKKFFLFAVAALVLAACEQDSLGGYFGGGGGGGSKSSDSSIPSDKDADPSPDISDTTVVLPGVSSSITLEGSDIVIRLDMTGVIDPSTNDYIKLYGTNSPNQNVWVEVDGQPKGIEVKNLSDGNGAKSKADVIFLVDNSGSMSEEADGVANGISDWSKVLAKSGLDIRFGCVGYGFHVGSQYNYPTSDYGIAGAMNLADVSVLSNFLNNRDGYMYGIDRTVGYYGADSAALHDHILYDEEEWTVAGGECSVQALRFAEKYFSFRDGASRVYVNFTDDANYPGGDKRWGIDSIRAGWNPARGTIHTVFSNDTSYFSWQKLYQERSWELSEITGGTLTLTDSYFTDVKLENLHVTGAMQNSYIIRFTNVASLFDGNMHNVKITVKTGDGNVAGVIELNMVFEMPTKSAE